MGGGGGEEGLLAVTDACLEVMVLGEWKEGHGLI